MSEPTHDPITREPRRVRPPYDVPDESFEHLRSTDTEAWRRAIRLDRLAALAEPLAGVEVTEYEHTVLEWLSGWEVATVAVVAALLHRARAASPLPAQEPAAEPAPRRRGRPSLRSSDPARVLAALTAPGRSFSLNDLVGVLQRGRAAVIDPAGRRSDEDRAAHAVVVVAAARALGDEIDVAWPRFVRHALALGASVADLVAASGLAETLVSSMAADVTATGVEA